MSKHSHNELKYFDSLGRSNKMCLPQTSPQIDSSENLVVIDLLDFTYKPNHLQYLLHNHFNIYRKNYLEARMLWLDNLHCLLFENNYPLIFKFFPLEFSKSTILIELKESLRKKPSGGCSLNLMALFDRKYKYFRGRSVPNPMMLDNGTLYMPTDPFFLYQYLEYGFRTRFYRGCKYSNGVRPFRNSEDLDPSCVDFYFDRKDWIDPDTIDIFKEMCRVYPNFELCDQHSINGNDNAVCCWLNGMFSSDYIDMYVNGHTLDDLDDGDLVFKLFNKFFLKNRYLPKLFRKDVEFNLKLIKSFALFKLDNNLCSDMSFMRRAVTIDVGMLKYASFKIRENYTFMKEMTDINEMASVFSISFMRRNYDSCELARMAAKYDSGVLSSILDHHPCILGDPGSELCMNNPDCIRKAAERGYSKTFSEEHYQLRINYAYHGFEFNDSLISDLGMVIREACNDPLLERLGINK